MNYANQQLTEALQKLVQKEATAAPDTYVVATAATSLQFADIHLPAEVDQFLQGQALHYEQNKDVSFGKY